MIYVLIRTYKQEKWKKIKKKKSFIMAEKKFGLTIFNLLYETVWYASIILFFQSSQKKNH